MDKFMKSLMIGVGASILVIGGIAGVGIWLNSDTDTVSAAMPAVKDSQPRMVRMRPQSVQVGGYSLKNKSTAKILLVSIEMRMTGTHNQVKVCRLMPRLVSTVNTAFANLAGYTDSAQDALSKDLTHKLKRRFNRALGENLIEGVTLRAYQDKEDVPPSNCPERT